MSNREISIILRAKNAMAAGLKSAGRSLQAFGQSALRIGKFFAKAFLGAAAAAVAFATKAIAAYAVQEAAERSLTAAINAHGQAGEAILPALKKIAAAIQNETGASDEATLAGMATMRMLGVQTSKLGEAAKAVIALKGLGLEEAAAQKAVAMAMQGNYEMLNRYVPALRSATSETEKAQIVNDLFARGYDQQAAVLDTVSGQWGLLKGRVGDLWEEVGKAIVQNDTLMLGLKRVGEAVKEFGNRVAEWVEGGGVVRLIATFKLFYADVSHTFKLVSNSAHIAFAAIGDGADTVVTYMIEKFRYAGDYIAAIWKKVKSPFSTFEAPKAAAGEGIITKRTVAALKQRAKIHEEYANRVEEIAKEQADAQIKHEDRVAEAKKKAAEADKKLAEATTKVVKEETEKQKRAKLKLLKDELAELQKQKKAIEDIAKARVQALIDQRRAEKTEKESIAKDFEKAKELARRERHGTKLSRKDKEFLEAAREIEQAKAKFAKLGAAEKSVEGRIAQAEKALKVQVDIKTSLEHIEKQNEQLLTYGN